METDKPKKEENIEELKKQLADCQKKRDEYLAGWQRARADFLNHKKEEVARMEELLKFSNLELILKILPILDNFNLAEKKIPENLEKEENVKGILQIKKQILDFLKQYGIEEMETIGKKFDPNFHDAKEMMEVKNKDSGIILEEIQKGYTIQGQVLRPAKVKVAK